jgi:hypothetical protein
LSSRDFNTFKEVFQKFGIRLMVEDPINKESYTYQFPEPKGAEGTILYCTIDAMCELIINKGTTAFPSLFLLYCFALLCYSW